MSRVLLVVMVLLLAGCTATSRLGDEAKSGGAIYNYESTDGDKRCAISGTSAKEVPGVAIEITEGCALKVTTSGSSPVGDAFGAIRGLVDRMPDMSVMP